MSVQTSYTRLQPKAYAGQIYALHPREVDTFSVETAAGIGFGVAVSRGTDTEKQIVLGGDSTFLGVTLRALDREGEINTGVIEYKQNEAAAVMRKGYVWVVCPAGCTPGQPVKYVDATGVIDQGAAGAGETQLDDCSWETVAAAGELALLRIQSDANT